MWRAGAGCGLTARDSLSLDLSKEDWKKHTIYQGYQSTSSIVIWFWELVAEMSSSQRVRQQRCLAFHNLLQSLLLQFCTGSTRVPIEGFQTLQEGWWLWKEDCHPPRSEPGRSQ